MNITYKENKDLPNEQLYKIFSSVGWTNGEEDEFKLNNFNAPFLNSTVVYSAWDKDKLVGCVRVISDKIIRSVVQDLAVLKEYQGNGIGTELLNKCLKTYEKTEWLVPTIEENISFYKRFDFKKAPGVFMSIPSKWF